MSDSKILEVCAADLDSVRAAAEGGASRVELCSALAEGGVTPSEGLIRGALAVGGVRVHVLIRPRPGDFVYTPDEERCMLDDIAVCRRLGVHGVVIGALTPDGEIDEPMCRRMVEAAAGMSVTFHRAFDLTADPAQALMQIISLGCDRVLTSGHAASAAEGVDMLARLHEIAAGRIIILAGGGVAPGNASLLTGRGKADELHASARVTIPSAMRCRVEGVSMGAAGSDEYSRLVTSPQVVRDIISNM